jgi:K+-sensing histidine kinase KdpD
MRVAAWWRWIGAVMLVGLAAGLAAAGRHLLGLPDVEMLYLLAVTVAALALGRGPMLLVASLSVASYDVLFVSPYGSFEVGDARHLLTFAMLFGAGLFVSRLVERLRRARTEEMRSALLSSVSHDLRTPLAAITGAATVLRDEPALDEATRADLAQSVVEEAERLERLVGNLLDMTRVEAGNLVSAPEWVPFEELVGVALARLDQRLAHHQVTTHIPDDFPLVSGDSVLLEQLLINVLDNVAKHTPAGTAVEVRATVPDRRQLLIEVADHGPGIPGRERERVFERFTRGAGAVGAGAGLGLAIARGIARAHGGELVALATPGGGATFRLTLPRAAVPS